jgi:hypothetical protein
VPRLVVQLRAVGVSISKRQVMRLLIAAQEAFHRGGERGQVVWWWFCWRRRQKL